MITEKLSPKKWTQESNTARDLESLVVLCLLLSVIVVLIIKKKEKTKIKLVKFVTSQITVERVLVLKRSANWFPMQLVTNIKMQANTSWEKMLEKELWATQTSKRGSREVLLRILSLRIRKNTNIIIQGLKMEKSILWPDLLMSHFRKSSNMLKMHTREKKIWGS